MNVLIGEPNTGKSNVLEALAVFSEGSMNLRDMFRFKSVGDFFYDRDLGETVSVSVDDSVSVKQNLLWTLRFISSRYEGAFSHTHTTALGNQFSLDHSGRMSGSWRQNLPARFYIYRSLTDFTSSSQGYLQPPYGPNLVTLLTTHKRLRTLVTDLFQNRGFRLSMDAERNELLLMKDVRNQLYHFSYPTVSETLRRIVFYMAVLETNQNAVLLLDEPEANTFPFYTTYLAERIALDETNQFFLTTHNPYILESIVAKTPIEHLAVFVTEMVDYQTVLKPVTGTGLSRILDYGASAFLNLGRLTEE
ncbi:MAG: ATP-binding protein [Verrucomicrobiales bacterium]|nr:ATP-binding protein [Verrucomicrobiales bacterium]